MEIINHGTDDLSQMAALSCCYPPGTQLIEQPADG